MLGFGLPHDVAEIARAGKSCRDSRSPAVVQYVETDTQNQLMRRRRLSAPSTVVVGHSVVHCESLLKFSGCSGSLTITATRNFVRSEAHSQLTL